MDLFLAEASSIIEYVYDPLSRLTEANYSDDRYLHYTHDSNGNRLTEGAFLDTSGIPVTAEYEYDISICQQA